MKSIINSFVILVLAVSLILPTTSSAASLSSIEKQLNALEAQLTQLKLQKPNAQKTTAGETSTTVFDYYIGPNGTNTNPGTIDKPWHITAITAKGTALSGKKIGLLDGMYVQPLDFKIGSEYGWLYSFASNLTIEAVHPRQAILTSNNNGVYPQRGGRFMSFIGNDITIRGLRFSDSQEKGIFISGRGSLVENCQFDKLYGWRVETQPRDNFGAVNYAGSDHVIRNNFFDDLQTGDAGNRGAAAPGSLAVTNRSYWAWGVGPLFGVTRITVENNTFRRVYAAFWGKRDTGSYIFRNNVVITAGTVLDDYIHSDNRSDDGDVSFTDPTVPNQAYNNVAYDVDYFSIDPGAETGMYQQASSFYNNTIFFNKGIASYNIGWPVASVQAPEVFAPQKLYKYYNNVAVGLKGAAVLGNGFFKFRAGPPQNYMSLQDYNVFDAANSFGASEIAQTPSPIRVPAVPVSTSSLPSIDYNYFSYRYGKPGNFSWGVTNATSCTASGAWSGPKALGGVQNLVPTGQSIYTLTCTGPGGSYTRSIGIGPEYDSLPIFQSATGLDLHSAVTSAKVNSTPGPNLARLLPGSPAIGTGRIGGLSTGAPTDMGAWGNGATQIGANFVTLDTSGNFIVDGTNAPLPRPTDPAPSTPMPPSPSTPPTPAQSPVQTPTTPAPGTPPVTPTPDTPQEEPRSSGGGGGGGSSKPRTKSPTYTTTDTIRVRTAPGTAATTLGLAPKGTKGTLKGTPLTKDSVTWAHIDFTEGTDGWVAAQYLTPQPTIETNTTPKTDTPRTTTTKNTCPTPKFTTDTKVITTGSVKVREAAGGTVLTTHPKHKKGTIRSSSTCTNNVTYYKVDFTKGTDGYVSQKLLQKR